MGLLGICGELANDSYGRGDVRPCGDHQIHQASDDRSKMGDVSRFIGFFGYLPLGGSPAKFDGWIQGRGNGVALGHTKSFEYLGGKVLLVERDSPTRTIA